MRAIRRVQIIYCVDAARKTLDFSSNSTQSYCTPLLQSRQDSSSTLSVLESFESHLRCHVHSQRLMWDAKFTRREITDAFSSRSLAWLLLVHECVQMCLSSAGLIAFVHQVRAIRNALEARTTLPIYCTTYTYRWLFHLLVEHGGSRRMKNREQK